VATDGLGEADEIVDIVAVDAHKFVASGRFGDFEDAMGAWTVSVVGDDSTWDPADEPPNSPASRSTLTALAWDGSVVVGFDAVRNPHAWYSLDNGQTWTPSDLDVDYGLTITGSGLEDGLIAVGRACCGLPDVPYGIALTSSDGVTWTNASPGDDFAQPMEALVGGGALGAETYSHNGGVNWRQGPPLPGYTGETPLINGAPAPFRLRAAGNGERVVAMSAETVWSASISVFPTALIPEIAPAFPARMPVIGEQYDYILQTHCGPETRTLNFDRRSWLPDIPEGFFPLSFDYFYEHGTLDFVAAYLVTFTGQEGEVINFVPTGGPPSSLGCH
jgi:hypothetical protein